MNVKYYDKLVLIACSTGGPNALHEVLPSLDKNLDAPVVIVQHMPKGFTSSLARRMNQVSEISVSEAFEGYELKKGHVYIARGGTHLLLHQNHDGSLVFGEDDSEPVNGLKPYANITFESVYSLNIKHLVCVVMTGMGSDGYTGINHLKETHDVYTIAQSKESCIVYGMPKVIIEHGLADTILPLKEIGNEINKKVGVFSHGFESIS